MLPFTLARVRHALLVGLQFNNLFSLSAAQSSEIRVVDLTQKVVSNVTLDEPRLSVPKALKQIRIVATEDFKALYPLISGYIAEPELALSVTDAILDAEI